MNEEKKKKLANHLKDLREGIRSGRIKIAAAQHDGVDALGPWVRQVLVALGEVLEMPKIAGAYVTDLSSITDFSPITWESGKPALKHVDCKEVANQLANKLGIEVEEEDYIVTLAQRLKDRENKQDDDS